MRPDSAEIQFYLRCSFVIYLLFFTYLAFVLRREVKAAQERLQDGTAWEHLCISVIFPRIFVSSAFLFAIPIGAFHLTFGWYSSSTLSENLVEVLTVSLCSGVTSVFIGPLLAFMLAGSTPRKVLPRVYGVLAIPFAWLAYGFTEMLR